MLIHSLALFNIIKLSLPVSVFISFIGGCASTRSYQVTEITFGPTEFQVQVSKYGAEIPSEKTLLILPPTGGTNLIDRSYARRFSESGYDVYILNSWDGMNEKSTDLDLHQRLYTKAQKAISLVIADIKSPYIGLLGTSVGALHAAVAASVQDKINAIFIIVGGAPISEIIITSNQKAMIELKQARKIRYNLKNDQDYRTALDQAFHLEPTRLGDSHKNKALGMAIALQDETVPTLTQIQLKNFWKPSDVINYNSNHFWGIFKTWWYDADKVYNFFEKHSVKK